ncbi:putative armadillo repeat-containing protein 6-like [Apostichopus japonicus]|nr:putative armadillo repeat-containing protein 6-like [Apostichopus japonicus]
MAKRISQETFDAAVAENIEEFEMSQEEAAEDAIKQFESQGVDLTNIITSQSSADSGDGSSKPVTEKIKEALKILRDLSAAETALTDDDKQDLLETMQILSKEFVGLFSCRSYAATNGGYDILINLVRIHRDNLTVLNQVLVTLVSFINGQPDLLDSNGTAVICSILSAEIEHTEPIVAAAQFVRTSCIKHEMNRQKYVEKGVIGLLIGLLGKHKKNGSLVKETCATLRGLIIDDDIRVPFGKGHDHAKAIVEEGALEALFGVLDVSDCSDQSIVGGVMATLGCLAVRNEFCQKIVDLGGLKYVSSAMSEHMSNQLMMKQIISMTKAIAGNDNVKVAIVSVGGVPLILQALQTHIRVAQVGEAGCSALAAISLRNPKNANAIMSCGAAEIIVQVMSVHPQKPGVQKAACMAVRNLVARSREYCQCFIEAGAETLIRQAMPLPDCSDLAKAALRDLECQVELKELWKGEKNPLTIP